MNTYRKIQFKMTLFDGYYVWLDIARHKNMNQVMEYAKVHLINFLKTFNLVYLENQAKLMEIYCNMEYNDILLKSSVDDTIYLYEKSS
jgi:hypothetical protein